MSMAIYRGTIQNDTFYFAPLINGTRVHRMILDTGAFELTFTQKVANQLGLPNLGPIQVGGVGGTAQAYRSECEIEINGNRFPNTPCIVDPSFTEGSGLFGLRFFLDNKIMLQLDPVKQTLTVSRA